MVESWTKNLLSTMMISGMIGMKRRMSKLSCSVPGSSAVWISGGISHRVLDNWELANHKRQDSSLPHWPAAARWRHSRLKLMGPYKEKTEPLLFPISATTVLFVAACVL